MKLRAIGFLALAFAATPARAATEDCRALLAAVYTRHQPYLEMLSVSGTEPAHAFQILWTGEREYLQTRDGWMNGAYVPTPVPAHIPALFTCRNEGATTLAGQSVIAHTISAKGFGIATRVWLSRTSGLIVRFVGRDRRGTLLVSTYDYEHVPRMPAQP